MLGSAALTWAAVGLPHWLDGWHQVLARTVPEGVLSVLGLWAVAHLAFLGALFAGHWWCLAERPLSARVLVLGVQTVCALVATAAFGDPLQAALLVIVAAQTAVLFSPSGAVAWVVGQSTLLAVIFSRESGVGPGLAFAAAFVGFQLFALLAVTMAEREAAARRQLARANGEIEAARELVAESSRVAERLRISRELHDGLGHHMTALSLQLEVAAHVGAGEVTVPVARAGEIAGRMLEDLRRTVRTLRDGQPVDVAAALRGLATGIPQPRIHIAAADRLVIEDPMRANALVRSVQELITNAVRHSGAANFWLDIERSDGWLDLAARDDGTGAAPFLPGSGLAGMRQRIERLGGTLEIDPAPGEGFRSRLRLPVWVSTPAQGEGSA
ncbi:MAG: histidine kinase [Thermoanaerobaculia bacterium]|nr:histidine kinase [Thermoanaerobaculia bacterium]